MTYENKKVLIFGGFGFLGLNLIQRLLTEKSQITVLDVNTPPLKSLSEKVAFIQGNISDYNLVKKLLAKNEILFNLAGRSGPANSMEDPALDLKINVESVLSVLQAAKEVNPQLKIVFPGSRLEFGRINKLPVTEDDPMRPTSIYGIHKLTAEKYHLAFFDNFGLPTTVLRISNPYGPHLTQNNPGYNIFNYFIDQAQKGETIKIFGNGEQKRDYLYVGDLVNVFLDVGKNNKTDGQVYNIGYGSGFSLMEVAQTIVDVVGQGKIEKVPWKEDLKKLETGDYISDLTKIKNDTGWEPKVSIKEGIQKTVSAKNQDYWK